VTGRTAGCPSCGAPLEFRNAATVTVVCGSCGGASTRVGLDLRNLGKIAEVTPLESLLDLGTRGTFEGKGWTAVGQVQLDHGAGPWNEWCLHFDDGSYGWLAEAEGELLLTRPVKPGPVPPHGKLGPGEAVDLGPAGHFVVEERGSARVTGVRGEIPFAVRPGQPRLYADLRQGEALFATLDYGDDQTCDAVFVGRTVAPADVGLDPSKAPAGAERRASADRIQCAQCGGEIRLRDPEGALRVACASCGSLLDPRDPDAGVLGASARVKAASRIPLGARGKLRGLDVEVIAFLVRSVTVEGVRYPWGEYLLKVKGGRYRWLSESKGHWLFLEPVSIGEVRGDDDSRVFRGRSYKHFQGGTAVVDAVFGEVYWQVAVGEKVESEDFIRPPESLTVEQDGKERSATFGSYATREEIEGAFGLGGKLPEPSGVAPAQPPPEPGSLRKWWFLAGGFAAADLVISATGVATETSAWAFPCCLTFPLLLMPALAAWARSSGFERARWAESDHPRGEGETSPGLVTFIAVVALAGVIVCMGGC
jgi:predicted RNA-binding Zn-ribbon protein involved in translation (DUF1610 family)